MAQILQFTRESVALDQDAVALAIAAYDKAVVELGNAPELVREVVAKQIIALLAQGERDPEVLYRGALVSAGIPRQA
jgi:hypothetical protein